MDEQREEQKTVEPQQRSEPKPADFPQVQEKSLGTPPRSVRSLSDVNLELSIRLGESSMLVKDVFRLGKGTVIELNKHAGEPIDIHINGEFFAKGEVLVMGDMLGIRITEIAGEEEPEENAEE